MTGEFAYCPICQLPLKAILIAPDIHVSQCMRRFEENNEGTKPKIYIKTNSCLDLPIFLLFIIKLVRFGLLGVFLTGPLAEYGM